VPPFLISHDCDVAGLDNVAGHKQYQRIGHKKIKGIERH
jgi:hypothetical protein